MTDARVAADRLDVVVEARMLSARVFTAALIGLPGEVEMAGLSMVDRGVLLEMVQLLARRAADLAVVAVGFDQARERSLATLRRAGLDWKALHASAPDLVPAAWTDDSEVLMALTMFASMRLKPPTDRCSTCVGDLPSSPPFLVDVLGRQAFCDTCAATAGHRRLAARASKVRALAAEATSDEQVEAALALLDRD